MEHAGVESEYELGVLTHAVLFRPGHPSGVAAVALLFAGGVGNLIDRVTSGGSVVDFINLGIGPVRTGIFNIADVAITVGVLVLLSAALRRNRPTSRAVIGRRRVA